MKSLELYINEAIDAKYKMWFNKLFKMQTTLIKDNKVIPLKINIKQIKGNEQSAKLQDIITNSEELKLINHKQIGFPTTSLIIKGANQHLTDTENKQKYDVNVKRFFYIDGDNTYCIAYVMYDESITKIEGFVNILDFDILQNIENLTEVQKFIIEHIEEELKGQDKSGMLYSGNLPKIKSSLIKQGFSTSKENKNWIIKNIK